MKFIKANNDNKTATNEFNFFDDKEHSGNYSKHEHWDYGTNMTYVSSNETELMKASNKKQWQLLRDSNPPSSTTDIHTPTDGYFCESPSKSQSFDFLPYFIISYFSILI